MLISILIILVLAILLFVALFQSAKTWTWPNIVFVVLVFITGIFAAYAGSQALKARHAWMSIAKSNAKAAEDNRNAFEQVMYGPPESLSYPDDSLAGASNQLSLATIAKGRMWTGGVVSNQAGNASIQFESATGNGAAQLVTDTIVHAFREESDGATPPLMVPTTFVGTFLVTSNAGNEAVLKPIFVSNLGQSELAEPQSSWALYENMPLDDWNTFKKHASIDESTFDLTAYRQLLIDKYLPAEKVGLVAGTLEYETFIDEFAFHGLQMGEIKNWIASQPDRLANEFDPGVENKYVRLQFTGPSKPFSVDAQGNPAENAFDTSGRAIDKAFFHDGDIKLDKGDTIVVSKLTGVLGYDITDADGTKIHVDPLIETDACERIGGDEADIYMRSLRNYPHLLAETIQQIMSFEEDIVQIKAITVVTETTLADARIQEALRNQQMNDLDFDLKKYENDLAVVTQASKQVASELAQQRSLISTYYKQVLKMQEEMDKGTN